MKKRKILIIILAIPIVLFLLAWGALEIYLKSDEDKKAKLPGNDVQYSVEQTEVNESSPLQGKSILFLGSSVTRGDAALGDSFVEYLGKQDGVIATKEAVSATTLADQFSFIAWAIGDNGDSYVTRLQRVDPDVHFDAVMVQLSTNDAGNEDIALGEISASYDLADFDVQTTTGAMEYIIRYIQDTWDCPVVFYTGSYYEDVRYAAMVDRLLELREKWDITVIDMYTDEAFNNIDADTYSLYMCDNVHPTRAGYREWWLPAIEEGLINALNHD